MKEYTFYKYSNEELEEIRRSILSLAILSGDVNKYANNAGLDVDEAWLIGDYEETIRIIDEVTKKSIDIGMEFVNLPENDPSRMASFYWMVEVPQEKNSCMLEVTLCLISTDKEHGRILLPQSVIRIEKDRFIYWGLD